MGTGGDLRSHLGGAVGNIDKRQELALMKTRANPDHGTMSISTCHQTFAEPSTRSLHLNQTAVGRPNAHQFWTTQENPESSLVNGQMASEQSTEEVLAIGESTAEFVAVDSAVLIEAPPVCLV